MIQIILVYWNSTTTANIEELSLHHTSSSSAAAERFLSTFSPPSTTNLILLNEKLNRGVNSGQLASCLGVIIVLSLVVIGSILFTLCRLVLKAAAHGETPPSRFQHRHASLLYSADFSSIVVPISFTLDDDISGERLTEKRRTG